ncbi:hypothetical protein [Bradyrhizobium sp. HKCCYLR20261]|uniref:hypothetical protein n=1 Tax=unclassified Bradyrhizobium TaxID=2631580 RepID=UPI003EBE2E1F
MFSGKAKEESFRRRDWTGQISLIAQKDFVSARMTPRLAPCPHRMIRRVSRFDAADCGRRADRRAGRSRMIEILVAVPMLAVDLRATLKKFQHT